MYVFVAGRVITITDVIFSECDYVVEQVVQVAVLLVLKMAVLVYMAPQTYFSHL